MTSISSKAFYDCLKLSSLTISGDVTSIGEDAFYNCYDLKSVTLPATLKTISARAFYACFRLKDITFAGTQEQWKAISKGTNWSYDFPTYTVHCSDGDITVTA